MFVVSPNKPQHVLRSLALRVRFLPDGHYATTIQCRQTQCALGKPHGLNDKNTLSKSTKNSEYDQEIPQSQTADNPVAPRRRAAQPSRDTRKTN